MSTAETSGGMRRRTFLVLGVGAAGAGGLLWLLRRKVRNILARLTKDKNWTATPPLVPHDPARDRRTIAVSRNRGPDGNVDAVLDKLGGLDQLVGTNDVVLIKVSAQWWNQGMTNVAAVKRVIERVLARPGFTGEVIVFENTHHKLADGSGLSRAWTHPSARNVDVPGWTKLGDLIGHFAGEPVSFVGLIDAGPTSMEGLHWKDPTGAHGLYSSDGRGPVPEGEDRDGYRWDFGGTFKIRHSRVDWAQTPLTWPVFTSPRSGITVDLRRGLFHKREPVDRKLTWISMTTANEHWDAGFTGCCKSAMGIVDMSAGARGTHPSVADYRSIHYFGSDDASWRMAGPLAYFAKHVRRPDLYLTVAEWVGITPDDPMWSSELDLRLEEASARQVRTVVGGADPVAIDTWVVRNLLMPLGGGRRDLYDLDDPSSYTVKFLREYRRVDGGTLDESLIDVMEA